MQAELIMSYLDSPHNELRIGKFTPSGHPSMFFLHKFSPWDNRRLIVQNANFFVKDEKFRQSLRQDDAWEYAVVQSYGPYASIPVQQRWALSFTTCQLYPEIPNRTLWRFYESYDRAVLASNSGAYMLDDNQYCIKNIAAYKKEFPNLTHPIS